MSCCCFFPGKPKKDQQKKQKLVQENQNNKAQIQVQNEYQQSDAMIKLQQQQGANKNYVKSQSVNKEVKENQNQLELIDSTNLQYKIDPNNHQEKEIQGGMSKNIGQQHNIQQYFNQDQTIIEKPIQNEQIIDEKNDQIKNDQNNEKIIQKQILVKEEEQKIQENQNSYKYNDQEQQHQQQHHIDSESKMPHNDRQSLTRNLEKYKKLHQQQHLNEDKQKQDHEVLSPNQVYDNISRKISDIFERSSHFIYKQTEEEQQQQQQEQNINNEKEQKNPVESVDHHEKRPAEILGERIRQSKIKDLEEQKSPIQQHSAKQEKVHIQEKSFQLTFEPEISTKDLEHFQYLQSEIDDTSSRWQNRLNKDYLKIWISDESKYSKDHPLVKIQVFFDTHGIITIENFFQILYDLELRLSWDKNIKEMKELKKHENGLLEYYCAYKMPLIFKDRDFVESRMIYYSPELDMHIVMFQQLPDELYPKTNKNERGATIIASNFVKKVFKEGKFVGLDVWMLSQIDMKMKIPPKLLNFTFPITYNSWYNQVKKVMEDYYINNPQSSKRSSIQNDSVKEIENNNEQQKPTQQENAQILKEGQQKQAEENKQQVEENKQSQNIEIINPEIIQNDKQNIETSEQQQEVSQNNESEKQENLIQENQVELKNQDSEQLIQNQQQQNEQIQIQSQDQNFDEKKQNEQEQQNENAEQLQNQENTSEQQTNLSENNIQQQEQ